MSKSTDSHVFFCTAESASLAAKTSEIMRKLFSLLLILLLATQADIYAKKVKQLTPTITWELRGDTLVISGTGDMPDIEAKKAPWFNKREKITSIIIGEGITRIGNENFSAHDSRRRWKVYSNLTSISLPSTLKEIGKSAFFRCRVDSLTLPEGIKKIEEHAFNNGDLKNINFPSSLTEIGRSAFFNNSLSHIIIPGSVKHIGESAFKSNSGQYIELKEGVIEIGESAFEWCYITDLLLPKTLKVIGKSAFNCYGSNLTELILPTGLERIGAYAFYGHGNLKSISIPSTVKSIGKNAFCIQENRYTLNDFFKGTILNLPQWITESDCDIIGISSKSFNKYSPTASILLAEGDKYYEKGDYHTAFEFYTKAINAREVDRYTYAKVAGRYQSLGDKYMEMKEYHNIATMYEKAIELYEKSVQMGATIYQADIKYLRKWASVWRLTSERKEFIKKGQYEEAYNNYIKEYYLLDQALGILYELPRIFKERGDNDNYIKYLKCGYNKTGRVEIANDIGSAYLELKDYKNAIEWYSIKAQQGDKETQYKLGQVYEKANNKNLAIFWYRKAAEQKHLKAEEALAHYGVYITPQQNTSKAQASNSSSSSSSTTKNNGTSQSKSTQSTYTPEYGFRDVWVQCAQCHGSGKCWSCHGEGWCVSTRYDGSYNSTYQCPICHGTGNCTTCYGTGGHYEKQQYQIR